MLLGLRRRIDPWHPAIIAIRRLSYAEAPVAHSFLKTFAVPRQLEVVGKVERIDEAVRRRKYRNRAIRPLGDDGPMADGDWSGFCQGRRRHALQLVVRVEPSDSCPIGSWARQARVIEN